MPVGSDGSAAGGGCSDLSEWPRSKAAEGMREPDGCFGYRNRFFSQSGEQSAIATAVEAVLGETEGEIINAIFVFSPSVFCYAKSTSLVRGRLM